MNCSSPDIEILERLKKHIPTVLPANISTQNFPMPESISHSRMQSIDYINSLNENQTISHDHMQRQSYGNESLDRHMCTA
jgi:hypothetical protein